MPKLYRVYVHGKPGDANCTWVLIDHVEMERIESLLSESKDRGVIKINTTAKEPPHGPAGPINIKLSTLTVEPVE